MKTRRPERFIHTYNFIPCPEDGLGVAACIEPFRRESAITHALYDSTRHSGHVICTLKTHTEWFIPDARKIDTKGQHKTLGYFTLEDVSTNVRNGCREWDWNPTNPASDKTTPAIPGASLRGMIRSIFETATLSCFSVFDSGRLDFRIGFSPDVDDDNVGDDHNGKARYVPCRILSIDPNTGEAEVQLLNGWYAGDAESDPATSHAAHVPAYQNKVKNAEGPAPGWDQCNSLSSGIPVAAILTRKPERRPGRYQYRSVITSSIVSLLRRDDQASESSSEAKALEILKSSVAGLNGESGARHLIFGWLYRTGPNWREKKEERIFFDANAAFNSDESHTRPIAERLAEFRSHTGQCLTVAAVVMKFAHQHLADYADRNGKLIKPAIRKVPRLHGMGDPKPKPSDFIRERIGDVQIKSGDLFYALLEELNELQTIVHGLYPVGIPRLGHENTRGDLLPKDFYPCGRRHEICDECRKLDREADGRRKICGACMAQTACLCPACRVFGWTRDLTDRKDTAEQSDRIDAWAGHVRFSHGILNGITPKAAKRTLPPLGSPKPTMTGFYLQPKDGWETEKDTRWPPVTRNTSDRNPVAKLPAYRTTEAILKGRKQYRRRTAADYLHNGNVPAASNVNQTVHALPGDMEFKFRIDFDNLSDSELGALLFAIQLTVPEVWKDDAAKDQYYHALGHGKPLGMGRCSINVDQLVLDTVDRWTSWDAPATADSQPTVQEFIDRFTSQWDRICPPAGDVNPNMERPDKSGDSSSPLANSEDTKNNDLLKVRDSLVELLRLLPDDSANPIQYPPTPPKPNGNGVSFEWWKQAKLKGHQLPEAITERDEESERLPTDRNQL